MEEPLDLTKGEGINRIDDRQQFQLDRISRTECGGDERSGGEGSGAGGGVLGLMSSLTEVISVPRFYGSCSSTYGATLCELNCLQSPVG